MAKGEVIAPYSLATLLQQQCALCQDDEEEERPITIFLPTVPSSAQGFQPRLGIPSPVLGQELLAVSVLNSSSRVKRKEGREGKELLI